MDFQLSCIDWLVYSDRPVPFSPGGSLRSVPQKRPKTQALRWYAGGENTYHLSRMRAPWRKALKEALSTGYKIHTWL